MSDRLSALDASFLYLEQPTTPMHVGALAVFDDARESNRRRSRRPRTGFDYDRLVDLIEQRLALLPRYRQKVRYVPGHLARPVWVDDADFDISYHVRRSALPRPGSEQQLSDLVARLMSRPLDRSRPLWETYLVEGLAKGRIAVITKTHQAMVDGVNAMDIGQVLLDVTPTPRQTQDELWMPRPEPGALELVLTAVGEVARQPADLVENVRAAALDVAATTRKVADAVGGVFSAVRTAARPAPHGPLNVRISAHRRFAVARTALEDFKLVRRAHGCTVNSVVLAVLSGALRNWLLSRGEAVGGSTTLRAMTPVSIAGPAGGHDGAGAAGDGTAPSLGSKVSAYLVDLPVGEPNPVVRLHHITHAMRGHVDSGQSVAASAMVRLGGFAPPTLHSLGARVANSFSQRIYNLVITNVPGPQLPLYAAGAKLVEIFPVVPLAMHQGVSIGVNSYNGGVYFGLNADRDALSDLDVLAGMIPESLDEMVGTVP